MKRLKLYLLTWAGVLWLGVCAGQAPSGAYVYDITPGTGPLLWDLSGYYTAEPMWLTIQRQDARGRLWSGDTRLGAVSGNRKVTRCRVTARSSWWETSYFPVGGIALKRTRTWTLSVDTNTASMSGLKQTTDTRVKDVLGFTSRLGSTTSRELVTVPLPEGNDGHWSLALNVVPNGTRLTGTATLTFAKGANLQFQLTGRCNPATGRSKLVLLGDGEDRGASLRLTVGGAQPEIESMRGMVAGQLVRF